jgi:hypothetical protein
MAKKRKSSTHYISNEDFLKEMISWKKAVQEAKDCDESTPPVTSYIAQCFLEIALNLAKKPNFVNYPFKEDMIGDAVENCLLYCGNFDPEKSQNPFSYFTQITYFAFLRRIQKEKKQKEIKYKYLKSLDTHGNLSQYLKQMGISEEEAEVYETLTTTEEDTKTVKKKKITPLFGEESE